MNRNILLLKGDSDSYAKPFKKWGHIRTDIDQLENCDLVVFAGGTDVNPALYGEPPHPKTGKPDKIRDKLEQAIYTRALLLNIPMVGICRGAQFLTVMNNGSLLQHIEGHGMCDHTINTSDGLTMEVRGDHHQAMRPEGEYHVLATSEDGINEVVHWPLSRCLGVQYHPEWMDDADKGYQYFQKLLDTIIM